MSRLLAALLAVALCATLASSALADGTAVAAKKKVSLKIKGKSQKDILKRGVVVKVKGKKAKHGKNGNRRKKVTLKLASKTYDDPAYDSLVKPKKVKLNKKGKAKIALKLSSDGKAQVKTCQARTIRVTAKGAKAKIDLVRDTNKCKPRSIDLSRADECDFIGDQDSSRCMLPFPDDYYTVNDPSSGSGRRIDFQSSATPANTPGGVHIDADAYKGNDGFSPGQMIVVRIPGLDNPEALAATDPVGLADLGRYTDDDAPVVVIDATTGERWPIWAEIDSNASTPEDTALLIHPAENFAAGHRYIVALRNLKDGAGETLDAPQGFRYYRDDLPSKKSVINDQRDRFDSIFKTLRDADVKRSDLYLSWDFTVATDENIAKNILAMRDDAFSKLGDDDLADNVVQGDAPEFQVTSVQNFEPTDTGPTLDDDANMARRVQGTFEVPCYMTDPDGADPAKKPCDPGATLNLNANGVPQQNGTWTANFNCMIPYAALDDPARPQIYGHGLLGSANEGTSDPQKTLGNSHNMMDCATDEIGMSNSDLANTIGILSNMSKFPQLADRLQQGMLNGLYLGRLLDNDAAHGGFVSDPAFRVDDTGPVDGTNPPVIDTSRLYYNGNSQGAIFGGGLTAVSPDFTRASLGVGGMNYSVLLNRSVDFDQYALILDPSYPDELNQQLVLAMVQMLWDRGETNGYAHRITDNPLPNTPPHEILMNVGFGDHQVSNFTADTMARTVGARVHSPVVYSGRWPSVDEVWGVPRISDYPYTGSALVYWDSGPIRDDPDSSDPADFLGTNPPPIENIPNRPGQDPHEMPRRTAEEQQMVSTFLQPDAASHIFDTCLGPCLDYTFSGP
jgi:hypothetical protein